MLLGRRRPGDLLGHWAGPSVGRSRGVRADATERGRTAGTTVLPRSEGYRRVRTAGGHAYSRVCLPVRFGSALRLGDEADRVVDGVEVLDLVVRDLHAELLLGVDDDGHHRQRVDVEVVGEGLVRLHVSGVDAGLLVHDLGETREDLLLACGHVAPAPLLVRSVRWWDSCPRGRAGSTVGRQGRVTTWAA